MTSSAPRTVCYGWAKTFSLHGRCGRRPCLMAEPVVIDYETFCKIHDCHDRQRLTIVQTARALGLDPRTVAAWAARSRFEPRRSRPQRGGPLARGEEPGSYQIPALPLPHILRDPRVL